MKRELLLSCLLVPFALFAQTKTPEPTSDVRIQVADPTLTPKVTQPPTTPAPTTAPRLAGGK